MTALEIFVFSCMVVMVVAPPPPQNRQMGPGQRSGGPGGQGPFPSQQAIAQFLRQSGGRGTSSMPTGTTGGGSSATESSGMDNILPMLLFSGGLDMNNMGSMALLGNLLRGGGGGGGGGLFGTRGGGAGMGNLMRNPMGLMGAMGALGDNMQALSMLQMMGPMGLMMAGGM